MEREYFIYIHKNKRTSEVFYVGRGTAPIERGYKYQRAYSRTNRSTYWHSIVSKYGYDVEIIFTTSDKSVIIEKEIEYIKKYGRKDKNEGTLCNHTDGGEGILCYRHKEETKELIGHYSKTRKRKKGYKLNMSEEGRVSISNRMKKRVITEETRRRMSEAAIGNKKGLGCKHSVESIARSRAKSCKPVLQFTKEGDLVKGHVSIASVEKDGFCKDSVRKCCYGVRKYHKNFIWRFKNASN